MKQLILTTKARMQKGRGSSRRLRSSGLIPANIYGFGGTRKTALDNAEFNKLWKQVAGRTVLIQLKADNTGEEALTIIKEVQRDPLTDGFLHIDFQAVEANSEMVTTVPIHVTGEAYGVKTEGGVVEMPVHEVKVRCLPKNLPEFIEVDVSHLKVGQSIHIKELVAPEGVQFRGDPSIVVVACLGKAEEVAGGTESAATPAAGAPAATAAAPAKDAAKPAAAAAKPAAAKPAAGAKK